MLKQCFTYALSLILASILVYSLTALAFAPINVGSPVKPVFDPILLDLMAKLRQCESSGNDLAIHYFDGDSHSYGRYQWKAESIWYYQQKYKLLPDIEEAEIMNVIFEPEIQDMFTYKVLEDGGWRNWTNCWKKING